MLEVRVAGVGGRTSYCCLGILSSTTSWTKQICS